MVSIAAGSEGIYSKGDETGTQDPQGIAHLNLSDEDVIDAATIARLAAARAVACEEQLLLFLCRLPVLGPALAYPCNCFTPGRCP